MTKGLQRSLSRGPAQSQALIKASIPIALAVAMTGASGIGYGTAVIGDMPEGNILILGAVLDVTIDDDGSANIVDTFNGDVAVGSAPTADATLSGAEVDIIPSTAVGPAVSGSAAVRAVTDSDISGDVLDNRDGTLEFNLQVLVDDADISADDPVNVEGFLHIAYTVLGD